MFQSCGCRFETDAWLTQPSAPVCTEYSPGSYAVRMNNEDAFHERSAEPCSVESGFGASVRRDEPGHRAEPTHRAGVRRTPGEQPSRVQSTRARGDLEGVSGAVAADADRSEAPGRSPGLALAGLREAVGEHGSAHGRRRRRRRRAGGGARTRGPPVQGRRLGRESALRPHQAELPARVEVRAVDGARDERARCAYRAAGGFLHPPVHRRPRADQLRDDEPRGGPAHGGDGRREPRAGAFEHARGSRAGPGPAPDQDDRSREVQAGRERRRHPRQGRLRERPDAAHPVRAHHGGGAQASAAHRSALDQQVLHPGSAPQELVHQVGGGAGAHRVRDLVGESG